MKINMPRIYVGYGPIGHPAARVYEIGFGKEQVDTEFYRTLARQRIQGQEPTLFFDEDISSEKQGYHVLEVINGEIPDDVLAALEVPECYRPRAAGEPGRKLTDWKSLWPDYVSWDDMRVLKPGQPACDHDFGLESYQAVEIGDIYMSQVTCTRCGAVHALPQLG